MGRLNKRKVGNEGEMKNNRRAYCLEPATFFLPKLYLHAPLATISNRSPATSTNSRTGDTQVHFLLLKLYLHAALATTLCLSSATSTKPRTGDFTRAPSKVVNEAVASLESHELPPSCYGSFSISSSNHYSPRAPELYAASQILNELVIVERSEQTPRSAVNFICHYMRTPLRMSMPSSRQLKPNSTYLS